MPRGVGLRAPVEVHSFAVDVVLVLGAQQAEPREQEDTVRRCVLEVEFDSTVRAFRGVADEVYELRAAVLVHFDDGTVDLHVVPAHVESRAAHAQAPVERTRLQSRLVVPQDLRIVGAQVSGQASVDVEAPRLVAARDGTVGDDAGAERAVERHAAADQVVVGPGAHARAVVVRCGVPFQAQSDGQRGGGVEGRFRLPEQRLAVDAVVAGEVGVDEGGTPRQLDVLPHQVGAGGPRRRAAEQSSAVLRRQAHLGGDGTAVAQIFVGARVSMGMKADVDPVRIVAVGDVRVRRTEVAVYGEGGVAGPGHATGTVDRPLAVVAGLVGQRRSDVVQGEGVVAVVGVDVPGGEVDRGRCVRVPGQPAPHRGLVDAVGVVGVQVVVLDETVRPIRPRGQAAPHALADRSGHHGASPERPVVAAGEFHPALEGVRRRPRHDVDQPRERVRAVTRPLRPAQHFHLLDVEQRRHGADAGQVDAVHHQADGRVERLAELAALPDTPKLQEAGPGRALRVVDVRHHVEDLLEMRRPAPRYGFRRYDGDAPRYAGQLVAAEGGADHDFLDDLFARRRGRVRGKGGGTGSGRDGQGQGAHGGSLHLVLLTRRSPHGGGRCFHGPIPPPALSGSGSKGPRTASASQALRPPLGFHRVL